MILKIFPDNINEKYIEKAVSIMKTGGVIVIPTDTLYALACDIRNQDAVHRISRLKNIRLEKANFSFLCYDLSNISEFTRPFSTGIFRMMKKSLPGPFTFILNANSNVPAIFKSNKKTIGIRVPDNNIAREIVHIMGHPLMVTSLHDSDEILEYMNDPAEIEAEYENRIDLVIDGGYSELEPSTVVDCTGDVPVLIRQGKGIIPVN
ncbi:MAG: threonylcarbamoyl-AMP synthase [Bacteroidia bacterium]|nr:threonylcarbamoyl-AMP synthase [Bacteroidia bacterium]